MPKIFSTIVELLRLDKPVGYLLVFFPALFGLFLAYEEPVDLYYMPVLFIGTKIDLRDENNQDHIAKSVDGSGLRWQKRGGF